MIVHYLSATVVNTPNGQRHQAFCRAELLWGVDAGRYQVANYSDPTRVTCEPCMDAYATIYPDRFKTFKEAVIMNEFTSVQLDMAIGSNLQRSVSHFSDLIDTRQVLERIEEIEEDHRDDDGELITEPAWDVADAVEHGMLSKLIEAVTAIGSRDDVTDGIALVRETYWKEYVAGYYANMYGGEWFTEDPGTFRKVALTWDDITSRAPFNHIDWDSVAADDRTDYSEIDYHGFTYIVVCAP